jgi:transcriptional regulator of heat shock response
VSHADVEEKSDIVQILEDIEQLKQKIVEESDMWNEENRIKIFIGKNPLAKSENLSIMGRKYNIQDKEFFLLTVGPKRMNYEESIKFFTSLEKSLEKIK